MARIFSASNLLVLPCWALMIALPHWRWTRRLVESPLIVVPPSALYAALVLPRMRELGPAVANPTLDVIATGLGTPEGATVAWTHLVAFDLFVGRWIYLDSREREISAWLMAPVLTLTLLFGPAGLLLYLALRRIDAPTASRAGRA